jgi:demethylmenaquinone methyltransferase/2-methoxy-6-polyprenyl-1,4-benzoquinol methylase
VSQAVTPYSDPALTKEQEVAKMFDAISGKYDLLNNVLSLGIHSIWRNKVINYLKKYKPQTILDVATGTGGIAIAAAKLNPAKIEGIDISEQMMAIGKQKAQEKSLSSIINFRQASAENIPFKEASFDAVTVGYGVRNFENLEKGLQEINRVMKKGAVLVILEFSKPQSGIISSLFTWYFNKVVPLIGRVVSKDNRAYQYLPESVAAFPYGTAFEKLLSKTGFTVLKTELLSGGIASIYIAEK